MRDISGVLEYKGRSFKLVFNLNVMEAIQIEYGSLEAWGALTDGTEYAKREYIKVSGSSDGWDDLKPKDRAKYVGEPDAKAVIFGFTEMINEGIDIQNEENGTSLPPVTLKQVGRMITEVGLGEATGLLNQTVVDSTKGDGKNE